MQNKLDFKEAFSWFFLKGNFKKTLISFSIWLLPIIIFIICFLLFSMKTTTTNSIGTLLFVISIIICIIYYFIFVGYYILYAHNRTTNKNAVLEYMSMDVIQESIATGFKWLLSLIIISPIYIILMTIIAIPFIFIASKMDFEDLFNIISFLAFLLVCIPYTIIFSYFIRDLKISSLVRWGEAFKSIKCFKNLLLIVVISLFLWILGNIVPIIEFPVIPDIISFILIIMSFLVSVNLLGQYTFGLIELKKENIEKN